MIVGGFYFLGKENKNVPSAAIPGNATATHPAVSIDHNPSNYTPSRPFYLGDYPCTSDCSGHEAGYEWAETNGISDPDDCGGNSESFIEGCQAYVQENE